MSDSDRTAAVAEKGSVSAVEEMYDPDAGLTEEQRAAEVVCHSHWSSGHHLRRTRNENSFGNST
jgi:hypothetical protein